MRRGAPGFVSCPDLARDAIHPGKQVTGLAVEAQRIGRGADVKTSILTGCQQLLPTLQHLLLAAGDGLGVLARIHRPQLGCTLLQLPYLRGMTRRVCGGGTGSALLYISLDPDSPLPSDSTCAPPPPSLLRGPGSSLSRPRSSGSSLSSASTTQVPAKLHPVSSLRLLDRLLTSPPTQA